MLQTFFLVFVSLLDGGTHAFFVVGGANPDGPASGALQVLPHVVGVQLGVSGECFYLYPLLLPFLLPLVNGALLPFASVVMLPLYSIVTFTVTVDKRGVLLLVVLSYYCWLVVLRYRWLLLLCCHWQVLRCYLWLVLFCYRWLVLLCYRWLLLCHHWQVVLC